MRAGELRQRLLDVIHSSVILSPRDATTMLCVKPRFRSGLRKATCCPSHRAYTAAAHPQRWAGMPSGHRRQQLVGIATSGTKNSLPLLPQAGVVAHCVIPADLQMGLASVNRSHQSHRNRPGQDMYLDDMLKVGDAPYSVRVATVTLLWLASCARPKQPMDKTPCWTLQPLLPESEEKTDFEAITKGSKCTRHWPEGAVHEGCCLVSVTIVSKTDKAIQLQVAEVSEQPRYM